MTKPGEGNQAITAGGKSRSYFLRLPKAYDNARAYPVLFGFHGAMRTSQDFVSDRGSYAFGPVAGEAAILVYPDALPDGQGTTSWTRDVRDDLAFFDAVLAELKGKLCVDTTRVFATGHSSGGFFSNALGCQRSGVVRAIGPVAGGLLGTSGCTQQSVAAFLVHGTIDSQVSVSLGQRARDYWIMRDGCMAANPMPAMPAPCVAYQGCRPGFPVAWCQHAETAYSGTGHAWPTWATKAIWNFFASL
jgi:poly(3-hydroxybutyrate) depolymerase